MNQIHVCSLVLVTCTWSLLACAQIPDTSTTAPLSRRAQVSKGPRYQLIMSRDDEVCDAVAAPLNNPPAMLLAPYSMRDRPPFSNIRWDGVEMLAGQFKLKQAVARIELDKGRVVAALPLMTVFPNGTFDTWLEMLPAVALQGAFQQDQIPTLSLGSVQTQEFHLTQLGRIYSAGSFGSRSKDRPEFHDKVEVTTVNDFDLLAVRDTPYLFMRSYALDDNRLEKNARRWAIVSKFKSLKVTDNPTPKGVNLDASVDHICYFVFSTR